MPEASKSDSKAAIVKRPSCRVRRQLFHNGLLEGRGFRPAGGDAATDKSRLVCLHGFGSCKDSHADVLHDVVAKTGHLAFSYDMRGHGGSFELDLDTDQNAEDLLNVIGEIGKKYPATRQTGVKVLASSYGCYVALEAYIKYLERKQDPMFEPEPYIAVPFLSPILIAPPQNLELAAGERRFLLRTSMRLSGGYLPPANLVTFMVDKYMKRKLDGSPRALRVYEWIRTNFRPFKGTVEHPAQVVMNMISDEFGREGVKSILAPWMSEMLTKQCMKTLRHKYGDFMKKKMALYDRQFEEKVYKLHEKEAKARVRRMFRTVKDTGWRDIMISMMLRKEMKSESSRIIGKVGTLRISSLEKLANAVLTEEPLSSRILKVKERGGSVEAPIVGLYDKTCCMVDAFGNLDETVKNEYLRIFDGNVEFLPIGHMSDSKDPTQIELIKNVIMNRLLKIELNGMESTEKKDATPDAIKEGN